MVGATAAAAHGRATAAAAAGLPVDASSLSPAAPPQLAAPSLAAPAAAAAKAAATVGAAVVDVVVVDVVAAAPGPCCPHSDWWSEFSLGFLLSGNFIGRRAGCLSK